MPDVRVGGYRRPCGGRPGRPARYRRHVRIDDLIRPGGASANLALAPSRRPARAPVSFTWTIPGCRGRRQDRDEGHRPSATWGSVADRASRGRSGGGSSTGGRRPRRSREHRAGTHRHRGHQSERMSVRFPDPGRDGIHGRVAFDNLSRPSTGRCWPRLTPGFSEGRDTAAGGGGDERRGRQAVRVRLGDDRVAPVKAETAGSLPR